MSLKSKLKIENTGMFAASIFYAIVGIIFFVVLATNFQLIHIGIIGILSLITAYGLFQKRPWSIWFSIVLFFVATAFSVATIYYALGVDLLLGISAVAYLVLTWIFTAYTAAKREMFES